MPLWILLNEALDLIGREREEQLRRALRVGDVPGRYFDDGEPVHRSAWQGEIDWEASRLAGNRYQMFILGDHGRESPSPAKPEWVKVEIEHGALLERFPVEEIAATTTTGSRWSLVRAHELRQWHRETYAGQTPGQNKIWQDAKAKFGKRVTRALIRKTFPPLNIGRPPKINKSPK